MNQVFSPNIFLDSRSIENKSVYIVRDDLLTGGTKQRAIVPFLNHYIELGTQEFVYASPFCGFAQLALAIGVNFLGKKCRIFCATLRDSDEFPELAKHALHLGAQVTLCSSLQAAEEMASEYAQNSTQRLKIPLGFKDSVFDFHLKLEVHKQWLLIQNILPIPVKALWVPIGSGTFAQICRQVVSSEVTLNCVNVRVLADEDSRIQNLEKLVNTKIFKSKDLFEIPCSNVPPVPSNKYYDAKVWEFIALHAGDGDIWWNIAGEGNSPSSEIKKDFQIS